MAIKTNHPRTCIAAFPSRRLSRICRTLIYAIPAIALAVISAWAGPPLLFPEKSARIALDPGHGGRDLGARGATGLVEKDVSLEFARKLALRLETRYQVLMTRSDDYQVELPQRTAIANQADADLFISLHTGAGYVRSTRGISIYYFSNVGRGSPSNMPGPDGDAGDRQQWEYTQTRYQAASLSLATALKTRLDQLPESPGCSIHGAPLAVLEGADMPAVLIEIGRITNPATEAALAEIHEDDPLVEQIYNGIMQFLDTRESRVTSRN